MFIIIKCSSLLKSIIHHQPNDIHLKSIQHLRLATLHRARELQNAVGERALAVVHVRNNAEVAHAVKRYCGQLAHVRGVAACAGGGWGGRGGQCCGGVVSHYLGYYFCIA